MTQKLASLTLGFKPNPSVWGTSTTDGAISTTLTALGLSFVPSANKTLDSLRIYMSAISGTPSITFALHADTSGLPAASATGTITKNSDWPAAGNWVTVDMSSLAASLTRGTRYWFVIKATTTGASATFRYGNQNSAPDNIYTQFSATSNYGLWGWAKAGSADGGSTWTNYIQNVSGIRVGYSDSSYEGFPASAIGSPTDKVYAARQRGVLITTPANALPKVIGIAMPVVKTGTPDNLQFRIVGGAIDSTTAAIPIANVGSSAATWYFSYLSAAVQLAASTAYRVVVDNSGSGGDASNCYAAPEFTMDGTSDLYPLAAQATYSTDGISFSETANVLCPFVLFLDSSGEFTAPTSGSGMVTHPGMAGGMNG